MKNSRYIWLLLAFWGKFAYAQTTMTNAEYYFDNDPGIGNGTAITVSSPAATINITSKIPTSSLSPGIHYLYVRSKNSLGKWSIILGREFLIPSSSSLVQYNITKAEYFFDSDPGIGNGIALPSFSAATVVNLTDKVSTASLTPGIHYMFLRAKNANGQWSIILGREFYVPNPVSLVQDNITKAEYYFDTDPGIGNGIALPSFSASTTVNQTDKISTTGLTPGIHYAYIRAKNNAGQWSIILGREFLVPNSTSLVQHTITKAEYYFDNDPGLGNATSLPSFSPAYSVNLTDKISANSLQPGLHNVFVRAQNSAGEWSIILGREFLIQPPVTASKIVSAEYFFDTDPGVGLGTPVSPAFASSATVDTVRKLSAYSLNTLGLHRLFMRAKNNNEMWGIVLNDTFRVKMIVSSTSVISNVSCNGNNNGNASIVVSGGTAAYTYSWWNGVSSVASTNPSGNVLTAGTYTVYVKDASGLSAYGLVTITQPTAISANASVTQNIACNSTQGVAQSAPSGGSAPYTYSWSPAGGSGSTASNLSAGTYTVYVSDANNCSGSASVTITQGSGIRTSVFSNAVTCRGGSNGEVQVFPSGGTPAYTYSWSTGTTTNIVGTTKTVSSLSAGTYTVNVTDADGCSETNSVVVGQPSPFTVISKILENVACLGSKTGAVQIIAAGGKGPYTYSWSNGSGLYSMGNLSAGTYTCTATDHCGFTATVSLVITQPATALTQVISFRSVTCNGNADGIASTLASGGLSPYSYLWLTGATTTSVTGLSAGAYNVKVSDANGCSITKAFVITQPAAVAPYVLLQRCVAVNNGTVELNTTGGTRPYTYSWSNGSTNQDLSGLSNGSYTVTVTDNNHCSGTLLVTVSCTSGPDMGDAPKPGTKDCCPEDIVVYPNPNNGQFTVSGLDKGMTVVVYDYFGKEIGRFIAGDITMHVNLSNQANGVYLIRIVDTDGNPVDQKKVVKTN